jgi:hypothetical protein
MEGVLRRCACSRLQAEVGGRQPQPTTRSGLPSCGWRLHVWWPHLARAGFMVQRARTHKHKQPLQQQQQNRWQRWQQQEQQQGGRCSTSISFAASSGASAHRPRAEPGHVCASRWHASPPLGLRRQSRLTADAPGVALPRVMLRAAPSLSPLRAPTSKHATVPASCCSSTLRSTTPDQLR